MATITMSGGVNPDITTKVSANAGRIGTTGNLFGGTADQGGGSNANVGGVVYRGTGQSSNQFPVSPATQEPGAPTGGAGQAGSIGSTNPLNIQEQVVSRVETEVVAQTTPANSSSVATGMTTNFPKTTKTADFGSSSSIKSNVTLNSEQPANAYVGINTPRQYSSQDPAKLVDDQRVVSDTNGVTGGRIDGKAQGADSVDKFQSVNAENLMTPSMKTLPGGVDQSQKIG